MIDGEGEDQIRAGLVKMIFVGETQPESKLPVSAEPKAKSEEDVVDNGQATQATGRKPSMEGLYSGNAAHGTMYTWYTVKTNNVVTGMELRQFNQTADTRYQGIPYFVIAEYTK